MFLPHLNPNKGKTKQQLVGFGGVNYSAGASDGELAESLNLSSRMFPALTQRVGRTEITPKEGDSWRNVEPTGLFSWNGKLLIIDDGTIYYDGKKLVPISEGEKQFAVVNTKLVIWPDKIMVDLEKSEAVQMDDYTTSLLAVQFTQNSIKMDVKPPIFKSMRDSMRTYPGYYYEYTWVYKEGDLNFSDGVWSGLESHELKEARSLNIGDIIVPTSSEIGSYFINWGSFTADGGGVVIPEDAPLNFPENKEGVYGVIKNVKKTEVEDYVKVDITYDLFSIPLGENKKWSDVFSVGQPVVISGCTKYPDNNKGQILISSIDDETNTLTFADGTFTGDESGTWEDGPVTIKRDIPDMDFICESENRLWGCGDKTIYASALGDPLNFYDYSGVSTDAYAVAVGSDGAFTGIVSYSGSVLVFKDHMLHKVIGSYPAEYAIYSYEIPGIQAGSHKSAVIINEALYYKARDGVYVYTGSTPYRISNAFGVRSFTNASAGTDGRNYYISMKEGETWGLWVYDAATSLWMREDESHVVDFSQADGGLYFLSNNKIYLSGGGDEVFPWFAEFSPFYEGTQNRKAPGRLLIRLEISTGAWAALSIRHDNEKAWQMVWRSIGKKESSYLVPVLPHRCDKYQIRLEGKGSAILHGLTRIYKTKSEV